MTHVTPPPSLRLSNTIKLPHLDCEPGPIHTILHDGHNIYYSDEVNHSIVSLNTSGEVYWHRSKKGNAPGEFHYPKGIELGRINEKGSRTQCVAVCDSWNRRIQFFDPAGGFMAIWDRAGDITFRDPVDIRFIKAADDSESRSSYWLILDRGHHALFGLDLSGNMSFRIGRCFPDNLESRLPTPGDIPNPQAPSTDRLSACLPYDPLFVPSRIFGNTHEALFVWEPKSRRLKQSVSGNLLPVWIDLPPDAEWVGVDAFGLLCHDIAAGLLSSYDIKAKSWQSLPIEGTPVQSGRTSSEIWTRNNSFIRHWICELEEEEKREQDKPRSWMLCGLVDEIKHIIKKEVAAADMDRLQGATAHLRDVSSRVLEISRNKCSDSSFVEKAREDLRSGSSLVQDAMSRVRELAHAVFLQLIKIQILQSTNSTEEDIRYFKQALDPIKTAMKPLEQLFEEMLLFKDEWFIERVAVAPDIMDLSNAKGLLLQEYYNALYSVVLDMTKSLWCISLFDKQKNDPNSSKTEDALDRSCKITERCFSISQGKSANLREIDRIFVGNATNASCVWPAAICYSPGIGFLVSLYNSCQVLRLNESGEVLGYIKLPSFPEKKFGHPHGIAVDDAARIWISIPSENRIEIIDASKNHRQSLEDLVGNPLGLNWPIGIHKTLNGEMLIADTHNSRILSATASGQIKTLIDHAGKNPGELRHPIAFCGSQKDPEFWVVEIRNHRLQRFNLIGQFLEEIGGFGLGKGHFVMPDSATIFDDGLLAVSQWQCSRELKLFSKYGEETLQVDYFPWGILAHKSILLVSEGFGNHIRIYERV